MAVLDVSVVNIALPTLSRAFHAPLTTIEWVVLAYGVTITGLLLAFGRVADRVGRRRIYLAGLTAFTAASALCAAANGAPTLIAARALQGLGAAMVSANSSALLVASFPPGERGRALGAFGAIVGAGLALGTPLGGLIVSHFSWRWLFLINLPLGALAVWLVRTRVAADPPALAPSGLDLAGTALWSASLVALMLGLSRGPDHGWGSAGVWPLFACSAVGLAAFLVREHRAASPLLPLRLLSGPLGVAVLLTFIGQVLSIAVGFHLPLYLEEVLGFDAARSGQWLATLPVCALLLAPLSGRLADRMGTRLLTASGMALTGVGFAWLSDLGLEPRPGHILGGMALIGIGQGVFSVPNASALLSLVPPELLGLASGLQATMRNLGIASGAALMGAIVASRYARHGGGTLAAGALGRIPAAFTAATHDAYLALGAVAALATILALCQRPAATGGVAPKP